MIGGHPAILGKQIRRVEVGQARVVHRAIQGLGAVFVTGISGSYTAVMGLPLFETADLLRRAGIPVWNGTLR